MMSWFEKSFACYTSLFSFFFFFLNVAFIYSQLVKTGVKEKRNTAG